MFYQIHKPHAGCQKREKCRSLSLVTLTFDLDLQTHPSEESNTSSVWIWRKSVQQFLRYLTHKQKPQTDGAKNRTFRSSMHAIITSNWAISEWVSSFLTAHQHITELSAAKIKLTWRISIILSLVSIIRCSADSDAVDAGNFLTTAGMSTSAPAVVVLAGNQWPAHSTTTACNWLFLHS